MLLVHKNKDKPGRWEVAWTWLPFFLAADTSLIEEVDRQLSEWFVGVPVSIDVKEQESLIHEMHSAVIEIILDKYSIPGLEQYLHAVGAVDKSGERGQEPAA